VLRSPVLLAARLVPGGLQGEQARSFEPALHVGELLLDHLEGADGRAEGLALAGVGERGLVGGARDADRLRRDADAAGVEHGHRDREALALGAEPVPDRHLVVHELDLAGGRGADAELGLGLAADEAGLVAVEDEGADALGLLPRVGHREHHHVVRDRARGDPGLLAVDDVVAAILRQDCARAHVRGIRPRLRLGQAVAADGLAGGHGRDEPLSSAPRCRTPGCRARRGSC
jgi:hypothetical protein